MYIGCAGWALSSEVAAHFPAVGTHLERYAQVFSAVEINSSFYRPHQPKTYARWAASVPEDFRFSVKVPRQITHELKLRHAQEPTAVFLAQVSMLGVKLGSLLLQLPPSLPFDQTESVRFLTMLRGLTAAPVVCEPRHPSWFSAAAAKALASCNMAYVHAHPAPFQGASPAGHPDILYLRLHGAPTIYFSAYEPAFIAAIGSQVCAARRQGQQVWCVFDNTARGKAIPNALELIELLRKAGSTL